MPHSVPMPSTPATPRGREPRRVAGGVVVMDQAEIKLGARPKLQVFQRREIGVVGARLHHRHVEELDRPLDARGDGVGDLDHDAHVLRQHHVLVGRAAVAQVIAELDAGRHRVADLHQHVDRLGAEIDRPRLVIAFPGQHLLADVPLHGDAVVRQRLGDLAHLADEMRHQRRQQLLPVARHHVVVGRRDRRRDRNLEFDAGRDLAGLLHALEHPPRLDRHVGVAGLERRRIDGGARLDAQPRESRAPPCRPTA